MKKIFFTMLLLATFILSGCNTQAAINRDEQIGSSSNAGDKLKISMLNIKHGDAILIQTGKQTVLVDTAITGEHADLVNQLEKLSVTKIDKIILTHPHYDHTGGAQMLINPNKKQLEAYPYLKNITVTEVYDNGLPYESAVYKGYMKAIKAKGIPLHGLKVGDTLDFGDGVKFKVLFPTSEYLETIKNEQFDKEDKAYNINNRSIVGRLTYKDFSMMFTGDCEKESEAKILANNNAEDLKCDVLKSGHHGHRTSSTKEFIAAINPNVVLISAGPPTEDRVNTYRPPYPQTIKTYLAQGIDKKKIYCTRWNGIITVTSDGKNFSVQPEKKEDWIDSWLAKWKKK